MQILSFGEIEQRYDGEWVLIAYTDLDENLKPIAGEVIAHSIDRDVVYDAIAYRGDRGLYSEPNVGKVSALYV